MTFPIIIDTDPGIDDAAAISIALNHPYIDVKMISTVNGNVDIENTTRNALKLKSFFNSNVPVHRGAAHPLINDLYDAREVHGESGMAGYDFPPITTADLASTKAVEAIKDVLIESIEPVIIIALGPLTNIALLLATYPETAHYIKEIIFMGGSLGRGNVTPLVEFNMYCDPEAANIVVNSGVPLTMVGLDLARQSPLPHSVVKQLKQINQTGTMLYHLFQHYRTENIEHGLNVYDVFTILYLLNPNQYHTVSARLQIELNGKYTKGAIVVDIKSNNPNCTVVTSSQSNQYLESFLSSLAYCK